MKNHTFTITVGAPDDLTAREVCRLLNRIINYGLDVALATDPEDCDDELIQAMTFRDAKPMPHKAK